MRLTESQLKNLVARLVSEADAADDEDDIKIASAPRDRDRVRLRKKIRSLLVPQAKIEIYDSRDAAVDELGRRFMTSKVTPDGKMVRTEMLKGNEGFRSVQQFTVDASKEAPSVMNEIFESINPTIISMLLVAERRDIESLGITEGNVDSLVDALNSIATSAPGSAGDKVDYTGTVGSFKMKDGVVTRVYFDFEFKVNSILQSAAYKPEEASVLRMIFVRGESAAVNLASQQITPEKMAGVEDLESYDQMPAIADALRAAGMYGRPYGSGRREMTLESAIKISKDYTDVKVALYEELEPVIDKLYKLVISNNYNVTINEKKLELPG